MAYKKKPKQADEPEAGERKSKKDLLLKARDCYKKAAEADDTNRKLAMEDLKFANEPGAQWDANMRKLRGDRPCYEFNKVRINGKRVINEIRANRPQGKVRAVEGGDKKTAELYEGLCRNIYASSDGDTIIDNAAEYQVDAGMAAWRVVTKYSDDTAFDQDIALEGFKNPFCVYVDPNCKDPLKRDAEYWVVTEKISNESYDKRWPESKRSSFESDEFDMEDWQDEETTRICEYWYREPYDKMVWQVRFQDGKTVTVDMSTDEAAGVEQLVASGQAIKMGERNVRCHKIKMCILSGDAILEQADWAGPDFPFVMIFGETKVIDGVLKWWGLHRFAKDAQQSYNASRTAIDEAIALAPKAVTWVTAKQAEGQTAAWARGHRENLPYRVYTPDPAAPGAPVPHPGPQVPVALMEQATMAAQDIRDVTGLHEASFGEESQEKSGIALARKQHQAQIVTYNFPDNIAKGIRRTWEIMIGLIPHIYDAERELRVIGADGAEDYAKVNQIVQDPQTGQAVRVNDLSVGKYDVTVTTGPNFSTMRQEAAEIYGELGAKSPELMQVAGDLVFKSMDLPYADEIAKRWQTILPPAIQQQLSEGKDLPPEAQAAMAQAAQAMQLVQQQTQLVQQAAQEVQTDKAASDTAKANVEKAIANLKTAEAQFETKVTKALADIQKRETDLALKEASINQNVMSKEMGLQKREMSLQGESMRVDDNKKQAADIGQFKDTIDTLVAQFMDQASQAIGQIHGEVKKPKPKLRRSTVKRVNGSTILEAEMDDGSIKRIKADRQNGELVAVPMDETAPTGQ